MRLMPTPRDPARLLPVRCGRRGLLGLGLAALLPLRAQAQAWPARPVRLIDPYAPGGSTSVVSRALAERFVAITGQQLLVDHHPGAAGNIGGTLVARAAPDGYTVLLGTSSLSINPGLYRRMPFDPQKDLAPVVLLIRTPNVLAVQASLPVESVRELVALARARPGALSYGSSGIGATNHLAMEQFRQRTGTELVHVPFKGGAEALQALLGGQIQVMFNPASTLVPQLKGGRLRLLAVASAERVPGLDLPTLAEAGVPDAEASVWFGLFVPGRTPAEVVARLNAVVATALEAPAMRRLLEDAGMQPLGGTPEALGRTVADDARRWARVARDAHVQLD